MGRAVDTLFVACTRPAMKMGVPFEGFVANGCVTAFVTIIIVHSPPGLLIFPAIHFALRELCRYDPHFFRKWILFFTAKMKTPHYWISGVSVLRPSRAHPRKASEVPTSV
jgi:type IV secretion system protein VirB3